MNIENDAVPQGRRVFCASGLPGWRAHLQQNYSSLEVFKAWDETYGLHGRLGFKTSEEAWEANPVIEGSVDPKDFRRTPMDEVKNCWTCVHAHPKFDNGGYGCQALTGDEGQDQPIIIYTNAHCDMEGDGMPTDTAPCPSWGPK